MRKPTISQIQNEIEARRVDAVIFVVADQKILV